MSKKYYSFKNLNPIDRFTIFSAFWYSGLLNHALIDMENDADLEKFITEEDHNRVITLLKEHNMYGEFVELIAKISSTLLIDSICNYIDDYDTDEEMFEDSDNIIEGLFDYDPMDNDELLGILHNIWTNSEKMVLNKKQQKDLTDSFENLYKDVDGTA